MTNKIIILIIGGLALISACSNNAGSNKGAENKGGIALSSIRLTELSGDLLDMEQFNGKTVFINFWATWCKPCIQEMPSIRSLMQKMKDENIIFLFASDETPEQINRFSVRTGFDFPFVRAENIEELNIMALPTTYIFTSSGELAYSEMGYRKWDDPANILQVKNIIAAK